MMSEDDVVDDDDNGDNDNDDYHQMPGCLHTLHLSSFLDSESTE